MVIIYRIKDYKPKFYSNCKELINKNYRLIDNMIGQKLISVDWAFDEYETAWSKKFPVIIKLSDSNYTLCAKNFSDFSIYMINDDCENELEIINKKSQNIAWRNYNNRYISRILNQEILAVEVINFLPRYINDFPLSSESDKNVIKRFGFLHGIGLVFKEITMIVSNGLDDNHISFYSNEYPNYYTRIIFNKVPNIS